MKKLIVVMLLAAACIPVMAEKQNNQPIMTPEQCIQMTRWLEQNPFDEKAQAASAMLLKYISDTPDFSIGLCGEFIGDLLKTKETGASELVGQYMFGMGAFCCEHPEKKEDDVAKQMAGVQSMIRTYRLMQEKDAKIKIKFMEKLLKLEKKGKLESFVETETRKCLG